MGGPRLGIRGPLGRLIATWPPLTMTKKQGASTMGDRYHLGWNRGDLVAIPNNLTIRLKGLLFSMISQEGN